MKVIVLSAGRGSRIKKFTNSKPKCFIEINSKSIIERLLNNFKANNLNDISVITGYKNYLFKKFKFKKILNKKWKNTNMVYSLFLAKKILLNNSCFVCYSDIVFDYRVVRKLANNKIMEGKKGKEDGWNRKDFQNSFSLFKFYGSG